VIERVPRYITYTPLPLLKPKPNSQSQKMPMVVVDPSGSTTMQPRIRSSQSLTHEHIPTQEELAKINQDVLTKSKQAWEYLEKQGYAPVDMQGN